MRSSSAAILSDSNLAYSCLSRSASSAYLSLSATICYYCISYSYLSLSWRSYSCCYCLSYSYLSLSWRSYSCY